MLLPAKQDPGDLKALRGRIDTMPPQQSTDITNTLN